MIDLRLRCCLRGIGMTDDGGQPNSTRVPDEVGTKAPEEKTSSADVPNFCEGPKTEGINGGASARKEDFSNVDEELGACEIELEAKNVQSSAIYTAYVIASATDV